MLSTIEITPSRVAGFFGYFAVLSLLMLPAAVAFARRKTSRWFLLCAGLLLLIGGALNWRGLLPTFSWNGYEPDWPPICGGAFLVMMLLAIFGNVTRRRRRHR
jgi:ABC-type Mn2+/Zn2+ transport system permease subunit